tara:strand:+ start:410 stop:1522 length:1113 start_codon:yes stop_codon:yes gene_type:complete
MRQKIIPVLLAGGNGARLWPLSSSHNPKQFGTILNHAHSLFQQSCLRVMSDALFNSPLCVASKTHDEILQTQLKGIASEHNIRALTCLLEPESKNTAAAIALAAAYIKSLHTEGNSDPLLLITPCDHVIKNQAAFHKSIDSASNTLPKGMIACFGIDATYPSTEYGYIEVKNSSPDILHTCEVSRFVEKPDLSHAQSFIDTGCYFWNSGIYLCHLTTLLDMLITHIPETMKLAHKSLATATGTNENFIYTNPQPYIAIPSISFDHAVMENARNALMIKAGFDWLDAGSYNALWQEQDKDNAQNVIIGNAEQTNSRNCYIRTDGPKVSISDVESLTVIVENGQIYISQDKRCAAPTDKKEAFSDLRSDNIN